MKERPCTEEELNDLKDGVERQGLEWDPDLPRTTSDIHIATGPEDEQYPDAFPTTADIARSQFPELGITELGTEEHYGRWAEEFTAEVEVAAGRFAGDPELPHAFTGLVKELREFRPATYQAKGLRAELEGMAEGAAFLDAMDRERERLVRRLERIAGGHMATTGTTATQGTTEQPVTPIQWKGTVQQLAWVLRELAEKGWIGAQTHKGNTKKWMAGDINASAFAKAMAPHFGNINLGTLERELKAEGGTVPAQDVVGWDIPQRPE